MPAILSRSDYIYPLHKTNIAWPRRHKNTFIQAFLSEPGRQTCMCKRGIR